MLVAELAPHGDDLGDPRGGGVVAHDVRGHGGDVFGDQARIEPIILGQRAAGTGELRSRLGLMRRTEMLAVSKARMTPRS